MGTEEEMEKLRPNVDVRPRNVVVHHHTSDQQAGKIRGIFIIISIFLFLVLLILDQQQQQQQRVVPHTHPPRL